jgi:histidyl-tRNA synthetase
VKTFYVEQMFRYAAPQKGRYREFWHIGFEAIGSDDPAVDAELIELFTRIEAAAGVRHTRLELNSIGDRECRPAYVEQLRAWLEDHRADLDEDALRKAEASPLRVFDTKNARVAAALVEAPTIADSLCASCREHFEEVRAYLDAFGVAYDLVPTLVRGLDYYTRTVWEFRNADLGAAQDSICAGGRYDYLVEEIGGPPTPGVGWAAGVERMVLSVVAAEAAGEGIDVFFVTADPGAPRARVLALMADLRGHGLRCDADYAGRSLKGQLTQAQRLRARSTVVVGADGARVRRRGEADRELPLERLAEELTRG